MMPQPTNRKDRDFTPTGVRLEGTYENDRNSDSMQLFRDIIKEVYGADQSIIAHHLTYVIVDHRDDGDYQIVEEIPSADTLIFDHDAAQKLWGASWKETIVQLAMEPIVTRDKLLARLYYSRNVAN